MMKTILSPSQPAPALSGRPQRSATLCQASSARGAFSQPEGLEPRAALKALAHTGLANASSQAYISHILNLSGLQGGSGEFQASSKVPSLGGGVGVSGVSGSGSGGATPSADNLDEEGETARLQRSVDELQATNAQLVADMKRIVSSLSELVQTMPAPSASSSSSSSADDDRPAAAPAAEPTPDSVACQVRHPGALCCTKTTTRQSPDGQSVTITLETTAKLSSDSSAQRALGAEDLATLAAQAVLGTASSLCRAKTAEAQGHVHPHEAVQQHAALRAILADGDIISAQRNAVSEFGHESFLLVLRDPITRKRVRAMFKPRAPLDGGGWHRAPIEVVAYELSRLLGMDLVPPAAYRSGGISLKLGDGEVATYKEGALMYWAEGARVLESIPASRWNADKDLLLTETRILDVLIHNSDRHHGNFLFGQHWARGSWEGEQWRGEMRPILIDHAAGFRAEAHVTMRHENAYQTGPVRVVSASTYLRLRFLDAATISNKFAGVLSEQEMRELLQRRNYVLRYLDGLVEEQGYAATVREQ